MSLVKDIYELNEMEADIAATFKRYNAKKAEYNELRAKTINLDAVEENFTSIKALSKHQDLLTEMYLELLDEHAELEKLAEEYNERKERIKDA